MKIIDAYLKTVKLYLPKKNKDDIITELADEIHSQVDEKEIELGRSLDESEVETILRNFGDPMIIASRYRKNQLNVALGLQIISPELFSYYLWILLFNLLITLGWVTYSIIHGTLNIPMILVSIAIQFVTVTFVFAVIDFFRHKFPRDWFLSPSEMVLLTPIARWRSITGLIFLIVFSLWWILLPQFPFLFFGATANLKFTTGFLDFNLPVSILLFIGIAQRLVNIYYPYWTGLPPITRIMTNLGGLVIVYLMAKAYPYVTLIDRTFELEHYNHLAGVFNAIIYWGFLLSWLWIFLLANIISNFLLIYHFLKRLLTSKKS